MGENESVKFRLSIMNELKNRRRGEHPNRLYERAFRLSPDDEMASFEATKKWVMPICNRAQVYEELSIMYEGCLPE